MNVHSMNATSDRSLLVKSQLSKVHETSSPLKGRLSLKSSRSKVTCSCLCLLNDLPVTLRFIFRSLCANGAWALPRPPFECAVEAGRLLIAYFVSNFLHRKLGIEQKIHGESFLHTFGERAKSQIVLFESSLKGARSDAHPACNRGLLKVLGQNGFAQFFLNHLDKVIARTFAGRDV